MLIIIPLLCFILIFFSLCLKLGEHYHISIWRTSYLLASIVWGVLLTLLTELLSILNLLTFHWVLGSWIALDLIFALHLFILVSKNKPTLHFRIPKISGLEVILLLGVVFIVTTLYLIALIAPPNTWDSMTYHMSRVSHWIQNHNVAHYPTHILRQLYLQPEAEFMIMHFQILSGGDRFANSIQWLSMIGSLIGVSLIAKQFGANLGGQIFAVVVCSTIPMGILQASSTQNDYAVTFWLICFVYFLMVLKTESRWIYSLATGTSLGLALLTKATAYIYFFPFFLWFVFSGFKRLQWKLWKPILTIAVIALFINLGHYMRNFDLFGHPLGGSEVFENNTNSAISVPLLISNIIRNIGLHIGTPLWLVNLALYRVIEFLHMILGISMSDFRITFGSHHFGIPFSFHENLAGNFLHFVLITASITIFLISSQRNKVGDLMNYCITVTAAFMLFALYLRWNIWNSRFHLPLFALWSPFIAIVLSRINNPFKRNKILLIFMGVAFPCLLIGWFLYDYFGFKLAEALYKGDSIGLLNKIIAGQAPLPFEYYFKIANSYFYILWGISFCFLLGLLFLYYSNWKVSNIIGLVLILASLLWVFHNSSKILIGKENIFTMGRIDQYFSEFPYMKDVYVKAIDYVNTKECSDIGIIFNDNTNAPEYPFFVLMQKSGSEIFRIEHINVSNVSSVKHNLHTFDEFKPCAIISLTPEQKDQIAIKGVIYIKGRSFGPMGVFIKQ